MTFARHVALPIMLGALLTACASTRIYPPGEEKRVETGASKGKDADHDRARGSIATGADNREAVNRNIDGANEPESAAIAVQQPANGTADSAVNSKSPKPYLPKPYGSKTFMPDQLSFGVDNGIAREMTPKSFALHLRDSLASQGYKEVLISKSDTAWHIATRIERVNEDETLWRDAKDRFDFEKSLSKCHDDGPGLLSCFRPGNLVACFWPRVLTGHYKVYIFSLLPPEGSVPFDKEEKLNRQKLDESFDQGKVLQIAEKNKFNDEIAELGFDQDSWKADISFYRFYVEVADKSRATMHFNNNQPNKPEKDVCRQLELTKVPSNSTNLREDLIISNVC